MTKSRQRKRRETRPKAPALGLFAARLREARELALAGNLSGARSQFISLVEDSLTNDKTRAAVLSDIASVDVAAGNLEEGQRGFHSALALDPACETALANIALFSGELGDYGAEQPSEGSDIANYRGMSEHVAPRGKIAVLSFLFNWPSTGGGIMHSVELVGALARAGFEVRHLYAERKEWGVGEVSAPLPHKAEAITFNEQTWLRPSIQRAFRSAVERFNPDYVFIADGWNFKPWLSEAVAGYPHAMILQAQETLCPLNNIRLLVDPPGVVRQCGRHQLATPHECHRCVRERGTQSGSLHARERDLSGFGGDDYDQALRAAYERADAVLAMNPFIEAIVAPYSKRAIVAPAAIDANRFPWPAPAAKPPVAWADKKVVFFAGMVSEPIKGFAVLDDACERLWRERQDFILVATGDPPDRPNGFAHFTGWLSQDDLATAFHRSDICVVPSIAQESFGRVAAEAMAAGKPVVASRLGGLPFTVAEGMTGLLFAPGDANDLASKLRSLLNDAELRDRMGLAGRKRFDSEFTWDAVMEKTLLPLLAPFSAPAPGRPQ